MPLPVSPVRSRAPVPEPAPGERANWVNVLDAKLRRWFGVAGQSMTGWRAAAAAGVAALVVFVLDVTLPAGLATPILYVAPVLISLWSRRQQHTIIVANLCTALTVGGLFFASPGPDLWIYFGNRLLALYVIWITTLISLFRKRSEEALQKSQQELEGNIRHATAELVQKNEEFRKEIADRKRAEESLRQLSGYLLHAQDDERRRIARELHDTTAQSLAAIALNLARLENMPPRLEPKAYDVLAESIAMAEECSREIRTLSYLLHPPLLEEAGLCSAVRWFADGFAQRSRIRVDVDLPAQMERLNSDVETTLFRIVQESLGNISRHSKSPTARIRLLRNPGEIMLEVVDEGVGIPPEKLAKVEGNVSGLGVGIAGIWERVRQFEGELDINSNNHGTTVTVVLPIQEEIK